MNAFPSVDMGGSIILTTVKYAKLCGIPEEKWIFPMGGAQFVDVNSVCERKSLAESPGIRNAARMALRQANLDVSDIDLFDIYSCFPSAVQIAMKEIGIPEDDPRPLTVTGGLPYFGGPGNNYTMHSIVSMVDRIRENPSLKGLVTANGMYITKHAVGIYGKSRPHISWTAQFANFHVIQQSILDTRLPSLVKEGKGPFKVEAFMISFNKENKPLYGVALGTLVETGRRALANFVVSSPEQFETFTKTEMVGKIGMCSFDEKKGKNRVAFDKSQL